MPTKMNNMPTLFVMEPNGNTIVLGKIQEAKIEPEETIDTMDSPYYAIMSQGQTATFTCRWNPTVDTLYLLVHGVIPSNNWRRMNGYRARRKRR